LTCGQPIDLADGDVDDDLEDERPRRVRRRRRRSPSRSSFVDTYLTIVGGIAAFLIGIALLPLPLVHSGLAVLSVAGGIAIFAFAYLILSVICHRNGDGPEMEIGGHDQHLNEVTGYVDFQIVLFVCHLAMCVVFYLLQWIYWHLKAVVERPLISLPWFGLQLYGLFIAAAAIVIVLCRVLPEWL
jgi:hypothetical protein